MRSLAVRVTAVIRTARQASVPRPPHTVRKVEGRSHPGMIAPCPGR